MSKPDALLPCPFCGGTACQSFPVYPLFGDCDDAFIRCQDCATHGPSVLVDMEDCDAAESWPEARQTAIAAWNRRAGQAHTDGLVAALEAIAGRMDYAMLGLPVAVDAVWAERVAVAEIARAALTAAKGQQQ